MIPFVIVVYVLFILSGVKLAQVLVNIDRLFHKDAVGSLLSTT